MPSTGFGEGDNIPLDIYNNCWRILSVDENSGIVRIVSAGTPLRYYYGGYGPYYGSSNFTANFLDVEIGSNQNFSIASTGFKTNKSGNEKINKIADLKNLFMNEYTAVYNGSETCIVGSTTYNYTKGYPKVQIMTKDDLDSIYGYKVEIGTNLSDNDLIAIRCKDFNNEYAVIILPGSNENVLYNVGYQDGDLFGVTGFGGYEYSGAKVVVELEPNLVFLDEGTNINGVKAWHIK